MIWNIILVLVLSILFAAIYSIALPMVKVRRAIDAKGKELVKELEDFLNKDKLKLG